MKTPSHDTQQQNLFYTDFLLQLDQTDYPTDGKLTIKIINRLNKLAKTEGVQLRRTYAKEVKGLRLDVRFPSCEETEKGEAPLNTYARLP